MALLRASNRRRAIPPVAGCILQIVHPLPQLTPMAPKKAATKRGGAQVAEPAAKKAKADPHLAGVVEALEKAADLPDSCRKMLLACIPHCFSAPPEERHVSQAEATRMIGEVIQGVESALCKAADDQSARVVEVEASKSGLQAALTQAEAALAAAEEEIQAKTTTLEEATAAVQSAKTSVRDAEEAQRAGDAELLQAQQSKAALEKGIESDLRAIVEGLGEPEEHFQALLPLLSGLGLDESLMSALPSTCKKTAADRGSFDAMVLEQLGARLKEQAVSLAGVVEEATPAAQARAFAVEAAQAELQKAEEAEKRAVEALEVARAGQQAAAAGAAAAKEKVDAFEPEYTQATQERDAKAGALENFRLYNVACFEQLRDQAPSSAKVADGGA